MPHPKQSPPDGQHGSCLSMRRSGNVDALRARTREIATTRSFDMPMEEKDLAPAADATA
eukprot:CAMPEP_0119320894 /NCGR_PEP_ID=MMETSP1333-20130426/53852_1 /TAXON_ID=418940 /ORGANISM="Scyphosphaera apsteinii, Strain RCC1455" /LENGTH=58 /DNA_ID=CAMNT_0007327727 /DNA_START=229 /DNA_END=405 /DNA_ORIENTATION=-